MSVSDKLHAKRKTTENHIKELESEGKTGERYTIHMPDLPFMILGLICDIGWLIQLIAGARILESGINTLIIIDILMIVAGIIMTIYLGKICEKEIALRYQKDLSFGLTALAGVIGIIAGISCGSTIFLFGAVLNTAGALPIYLSFRKGITYGIK